MKMRGCLPIFLSGFLPLLAWSLPTVAVLDLSSPKGIDSSVIVPVTESIMEEVVGAKGRIRTIVGTGDRGTAGDDGEAIKAQLNGPKGLAVDAAGRVFIADSRNACIRRVIVDGLIETVVGVLGRDGGNTGDGGPANGAYLQEPVVVQVDGQGSLWIADSKGNVIRKAYLQ